MSHTPGPWVVEDSRKFKRKALRQNILMVVAVNGGMPGLIVNQGGVTKTDEANARLIAAAPDLLRELKHLARLLEPALNNGKAHVPGLATVNAAWLAIAKAEGK